MTTIKVVLALTSIYNWKLQQLDVSNAYLCGEISEDVYMVIPPRLCSYPSNQCYKLKKSLYNLKQATWYKKISFLL